jgi:hypothetical protein
MVCTLISDGECVMSVWAMWGQWRGSAWGREAVERVQGVQGVSSSRRIRERGRKGYCKVFFNLTPKVCMDLLSPLPNTRGQRREGCYSRISTRGVRGCWEGQGGGLVKFQIILN